MVNQPLDCGYIETQANLRAMLAKHLKLMSDRVQLEKAEARMLVPSYFATLALLGRPAANVWLTKQISKAEKHHGKGFDSRCRGYMREITETELCVEQQG
jgi:hypothetical protein